jgi:hypothetical protein
MWRVEAFAEKWRKFPLVQRAMLDACDAVEKQLLSKDIEEDIEMEEALDGRAEYQWPHLLVSKLDVSTRRAQVILCEAARTRSWQAAQALDLWAKAFQASLRQSIDAEVIERDQRRVIQFDEVASLPT